MIARSRRPSRGRSALLAGAVGVLVYLNALGNGFAYDDVPVVVEDDALAAASELPGRLLEPYWPEDAQAQLGLWRPLTTAAFAAQRLTAGLDPRLFHAVNVLLHGVVVGLVVLLAAELLPPLGALLAGLLFATHPLHVEAVANVVGLAELLSAVPYLTACLLFLRWTSRGGRGLGAGRLVLLGLLYALAFLAKESAVTLPAALVTLDLVREPVRFGRLRAYAQRRGPALVVLALVAGAVLAARWVVLGSVADPDAPLGARLLQEVPRAPTLGVVWLHYARLLVLPTSLSADYSPDVVPVLTVWTPAAVAGVTVVLLTLAGAWIAWRRAEPGRGAPIPGLRLPALVTVWFLVTVSPVSNVLFLSGVLLAERTLYLPSVGFALGLGGLLAAAVSERRMAGTTLTALVLLSYSARTWTRTPTWESTERVFLTLAEEHPESGRAVWMLGDRLAGRGEVERANVYHRRAVALLDSSPWLLRELGWSAVARGDDRLGEFLLLRAREVEPDHPAVARRLALLYARQGRHEEAVASGRRVVRREPDNVVHWHLLAASLEALGEWEEAVEARERVIALGEDPWQQWLSLARLRLTAGDSASAERALREALDRAPDAAARAAVRDGFLPIRQGGGEAG